MAAFTLGTASQATGYAKSSILRAIRAGRISAIRDDTQQWQIDPAELFRVFPALAVPGNPPVERDATDPATDILVAELRATIADLRRDRDHWQAAHEREQAAHAATQRLLLPAPQPASERDATAPERENLGSTSNPTFSAPAGETRRNGWRWWRRAAAAG